VKEPAAQLERKLPGTDVAKSMLFIMSMSMSMKQKQRRRFVAGANAFKDVRKEAESSPFARLACMRDEKDSFFFQ